jgi:hypothetical protein
MALAYLPTPGDVAAAALRKARLMARRRAAAANARRLRLTFTFPSMRRANLTVIFDGEGFFGPFAVRALLLDGRRAHLTRDSVDGLPDGDDPNEVVASMTPSPIFGHNVHRVMGVIGIESARGEPRGEVQIEIIDSRGVTLAAVRRRF